MASPTVKSYDSTRWETKRVLLSGIPSTPSELSINYIRCRPPQDGVASASSSAAKGHILLIHGFPETSYQFRHVITPLADAGYDVIVPDYRGAGSSSRPREGFEKAQMATDLHDLLTKQLGIHQSVHVVGHDIGGMIAHAYAMKFADHTASLDLPELLTAGREREYIRHFYERLGHNPSGIAQADIDYYAAQYSQAGAMRCGFDVYRAFHADARDNQQWLASSGRSKVPCLMLNGAESSWASTAEEQGKEVYEGVQVGNVDASGHWCAEENPKDFVIKLISFVDQHGDT
ncbi:MAG: hypothetical protein M1831_002519 [Alyxoria varia]|nr:MAG: hypothetical protein M1831_002519 [Alyxoria varia]